MPDNAALVKRRDGRDATGRPRAIPATAKAAIQHLLTEPSADLASAPKAAGLVIMIGTGQTRTIEPATLIDATAHAIDDDPHVPVSR
jgi:hypothetical protein